MRRITSFILTVLILFSFCTCSGFSEDSETVEVYLDKNNKDMLTFGNLVFDLPADEFLGSFEPGDIVTVAVDGCDPLDVPVCASYDDVAPGEMLLLAKPGKSNITLAINYGQIGVVLGVLKELANGSENRYAIKNGIQLPLKMTVTMKEKGGYKAEILPDSLYYPNDRNEYAAAMSDEQFANFREVNTTGMGKNVLYRSSSPIDDSLSRNTVADALAKNIGIRTFLDLSDSQSAALAFPGYEGSYFSTQNVFYGNLSSSFKTPAFSAGLAEGLRYMTSQEAPYLLHCLLGRDRTGFVAAVLELFMGADLDEVKDDYLLSYENFYAELKNGGVQLNDPIRKTIRELIEKNLEYAYGIDDLSAVDSVKATEEYLLSIGLSAKELAALRRCLQ